MEVIKFDWISRSENGALNWEEKGKESKHKDQIQFLRSAVRESQSLWFNNPPNSGGYLLGFSSSKIECMWDNSTQSEKHIPLAMAFQ